MKTISALWLILALFIAPCVCNLENLAALVFVMVNVLAAFVVNRKVNPEFFK